MILFFGQKKIMRTQKNSRPSEIDINLKYVCKGCRSEHWVSMQDIQNPKHKIHCYFCDISIEIDPISNIDIIYISDKLKKDKEQQKRTEQYNKLDTIDRCAITLVSYGFSKDEAKNLSWRAYEKYQTEDIGFLVKKIIFDFGSTLNESKAENV